MARKILLLFSSLIFSLNVFSQASAKFEPQWLHKLPKPTNNTFMYETHTATARSLNGARDLCLKELTSNSEMINGMIVVSDKSLNTSVQQTVENGVFKEKSEIKGNFNTDIKTNEVKLYVNKIDEYWERDTYGNYNLTVLYAKSELHNRPVFDDIELTTKYGGHGVWRSAIVPGWGQLYKGSKLKGGLIMGGTVATIGGIIVTECVRSDYSRKISKTKSADIKRAYATKVDHYAMGRNICIGALAALYVYNIIDAAVAPGARRVVIKDRKDRRYSFLPSVTEDGEPSLSAYITF